VTDPRDAARGRELATSTLDRLKRIEVVPALPDILIRIWDLVARDDTSAKELAEVMSRDPGLTGAVLRLANSAYFGFPRKITTVTQAIVVLGFNTVQGLATGASVFRTLQTQAAGLDSRGFLQHSLVTAAAARKFASRRGVQRGGTAFAAGILHDLGKLVIAEYLNDCHQVIADRVGLGIPYEEAERAELGVTHQDVGAWFAGRWNLPGELAAAIRWHHEPEEGSEHLEMVAAVHLGDLTAHRIGANRSGRPQPPPLAPAALTMLDVTEEDLETVGRELTEQLENGHPADVPLGV
jgi:HD-like signal output (HDOD) protein